MWIRRMQAVFGRLQGDQLQLREGLNILEAPNETGKSTWAAFYRSMLYGVNTAERSKNGSLPDKKRYLPWSGAPMEGVMELSCSRGEITLSRPAVGAGKPMGPCSAVYTGTGEKVTELLSAGVGELLTGVPEAVLKRSAFISGSELRVDADRELEKKITALVTSGEEGDSYTEADERLRRWQRKRRWRSSSGRINELEAEYRAAGESLARIEEMNSRLSQLREEQEKLNLQKEQLELEVRRHRRDAALQARQRREAALRAAEADRSRLQTLEAKAGSLSQEDIGRLREAQVRLEEAEKDLRALEKETQQARQEHAALPAPGAYPADSRGKWSVLLFVLAGLLSAAGVLCLLAVLPLGQLPGILLCAVGLVSLLGGVLCLSARRKARKALDGERSKALELARFRLKDLEAREQELRSETEDCRTAREAALAVLGTGSEPEAAMRDAQELLRAVENARADARTSAALAESLEREGPIEAVEEVEGETRLGRAEAEDYLRRADSRLREVSRELARNEGYCGTLEDPLVAATRRQNLEEALQKLNLEYEALELAIDAMRRANVKLQTLFSPIVSREAARLLGKMTGGAYSGVYFDREMHFSTQREGDPSAHALEYLSEGARNQVYLAVRLAICSLVLPKDDPCPLILDDVLATFDDVRAKQTLRLLRELARERQILLFTCRSRERELLQQLEEEEG